MNATVEEWVAKAEGDSAIAEREMAVAEDPDVGGCRSGRRAERPSRILGWAAVLSVSLASVGVR